MIGNNVEIIHLHKKSQPLQAVVEFELTTPVLFLIFNRPDITQKVFNEIRKAKPKQLFVSADGPRESRPGEYEKCKLTRELIKQVDWNCEVYTNFRDSNLGCKIAVSSGIDWFFEHVEEGIILEDDCLPHPSFFAFCQELLKYYREDNRIIMITGSNFQFEMNRTKNSYFYSEYTIIWGWASWRRAWNYYDVNMRLWPELREGEWLQDLFGNMKMVKYWTGIFDKVYKGAINTWDYQWNFASWVQNGLTVIPNVNLISNIGCGNDSTHTSDSADIRSNMPTQEITFPLKHPSFVIRDTIVDKYIKNTFYTISFWQRIKFKINDLINLFSRH